MSNGDVKITLKFTHLVDPNRLLPSMRIDCACGGVHDYGGWPKAVPMTLDEYETLLYVIETYFNFPEFRKVFEAEEVG